MFTRETVSSLWNHGELRNLPLELFYFASIVNRLESVFETIINELLSKMHICQRSIVTSDRES